ncbi:MULTISPECIES: hypothetical protein [Burkholderiaceae]|uniref:hypothetical protein n=1 Tax=Burkholderiaceae TaxID=119060 RepID=UPI00095D6468|nr:MULTISPECIES: hypothetical protein [Burkholderiaceae]MCG1039407.1 hypothetical protein [Mycetohabitans sp. B7]SIT64911.1 hypothetical protein SAMN04487769_0128 [Burkholderia sp. b14]
MAEGVIFTVLAERHIGNLGDVVAGRDFYAISVDQAHARFVVPPAFLSERKSVGIGLAAAGTTVTAFLIRFDLGIAALLCEVLIVGCLLRWLGPVLSESRFSISAAGIVWYGLESEPTYIAMHRIGRVCLVSPSGRCVVLLSRRAASSEPQALPWRLADRRHLAKWRIVVEADGLYCAIAQGLSRHTAIRLARAVRRVLRVALRDGYGV